MDVRHASEIAAYRAFSKKICTEIEDQVIAPNLFTPAAPSSTEPTPGVVAREQTLAASQAEVSMAGLGPSQAAPLLEVPEQGRPPSIADDQSTKHAPDDFVGNTFLTAVQHESEGGTADLGRHGETGKPTATELGSSEAKPAGGEPAADKAGIVGHSGEGTAWRGQGSLWDRGQARSDSFDKQRMTLTSAR